MSNDQADDRCPYCQSSFEIVCVKFRLGGVEIISTCPNCAVASAEECRSAESKILVEAKQLANTTRSVWQGVVRRMDSLNLPVRYVLAFMIGAVIAAAALRHGIHVYAGISPEEIRNGALVAIPAVALVLIAPAVGLLLIVLRKKRAR